jgi:hypothetical protein
MSDDILSLDMDDLEIKGGYVLEHRNTEDTWIHKSNDFYYAFRWLIRHAAWEDNCVVQRGQIKGSTRAWAVAWRMKQSAVSRFLRLLEKDNRITWVRGKLKHASNRDSEVDSVASVVTILDYNYYNGIKNGTDSVLTQKLTHLKKINIDQLEKSTVSSETSSTESVSNEKIKSTAKRKTEEEDYAVAEAAMIALDLGPYREKYPALNIDDAFEDFCQYYLSKPGTFHGPKKFTKWNLVLHRWCKNQIKFQKDRQPKQDDDLSPEARKLRELYGPR